MRDSGGAVDKEIATVSLFDISGWRPINLTTVDGTFALEANAFKNVLRRAGRREVVVTKTGTTTTETKDTKRSARELFMGLRERRGSDDTP